jgi:antirestriction protein ArdC
VTKPGKILAAYSLFHNYSLGNAMLALIQCQVRGIHPGPINTFPGWKALGRHVLKGQKAISLVMPITGKKRDEDNQQAADAADSHDSRKSECFTRFVFRPNWFVLSQTEGNDVAAATAPNWNAELALSTLGITRVEFTTMNGNAQGYAALGKQIAINRVAVLPHKTMFHELAHVVLGHTEEGLLSDDEQTPRSLREVEAESVALLCCASLGLEGEEFARGYIQNWLGVASIPEKSAQKIFATAAAILKAGQEKPQQKGAEDTAT